mmetsp:Transcript_1873/g.4167  ORF Transcript_1873/g.4167 Transcript_1873/m.4167 type:complete len:272 (+) Transcript_1873:624-1439(+)
METGLVVIVGEMTGMLEAAGATDIGTEIGIGNGTGSGRVAGKGAGTGIGMVSKRGGSVAGVGRGIGEVAAEAAVRIVGVGRTNTAAGGHGRSRTQGLALHGSTAGAAGATAGAGARPRSPARMWLQQGPMTARAVAMTAQAATAAVRTSGKSGGGTRSTKRRRSQRRGSRRRGSEEAQPVMKMGPGPGRIRRVMLRRTRSSRRCVRGHCKQPRARREGFAVMAPDPDGIRCVSGRLKVRPFDCGYEHHLLLRHGRWTLSEALLSRSHAVWL